MRLPAQELLVLLLIFPICCLIFPICCLNLIITTIMLAALLPLGHRLRPDGLQVLLARGVLSDRVVVGRAAVVVDGGLEPGGEGRSADEPRACDDGRR